MKRRTRFLALTAGWALLGLSLEASTVARLSTVHLVAQADRIVTGRCSSTESAWMDGTLVTLARFEVSETLKGKSGAGVVLVVPGGIDLHHNPPLQLLYPGSPQITTGEEALLFLETLDDTAGTFVLVGFSQGLYAFAAGGQRAERDLSLLTLLDPEGRRIQGRRDHAELAGLLAEVRALAAGEARP